MKALARYDHDILQEQGQSQDDRDLPPIKASGEELIVTDHGKPVLKIVPLKHKATAADLFGNLQGKVTYLEHVNTPTLTEWDEA